MSAVLDSLVPVFLLVAIGWGARASGFVPDRHWAGLEHVTYFLFFPAIVIDTLARADLSSVPVIGVGGALVATILGVATALVLARPLLARRIGLDGPAFTSLFQGCARWNTFVALSVAASLYGPRGLTLMAVAIAAMIPLLNILCTTVLVRFASGPPLTGWALVRTFVTNPFIWSCAVGLALNLAAIPLPRPLGLTLEALGRPALAAGLLVVGAGLALRGLARPRAVHLIAIGVKLVVFPVVAAVTARALGVGGIDLAVAVLAGSVPTASGSYILAKQMGGDAPLMAEILTLQTVVALATMPVMLALLAG